MEVRERERESGAGEPGEKAPPLRLSLSPLFSLLVIAPKPLFSSLLFAEFNVGTALQYGEATIDKKSFAGQDLRRSNFTAASCRSCNFAKTKLNGAERGGEEGRKGRVQRGKERKSTNVRAAMVETREGET